MKKIASFLLLLLCFPVLFISAKPLNSLRTEHFEIIYPKESEHTASILYANAEEIYTSISSLIGNIGESIFLPVVIRSDIKTLNAFYSGYPYHRIVMYDTFGNASGTLNYKEKTLNIFTHELTHALLFNHKGKFSRVLSNIFSDGLSIQGLYVHPSFSEGLSVYTESREGSGRLSSNYFLHTVKQAKIEGAFPSWYKTIGSADYGENYGSAYSFGGPFVSFLAYKYGGEKLSEFFTGSAHLVLKTVSVLFRETYGAEIEQVWEDFRNSIKIPEKILHANNITPLGSYQNVYIVNNELYTLNKQKSRIEIFNANTAELTTFTDSRGASNFSVSGNSKIVLGVYSDTESQVVVLAPTEKKQKKQSSSGAAPGKKPELRYEAEHIFKGYYAGFIFGSERTALLRNEGGRSFIDLYNSRYVLYKTITLPYGTDVSSFSVYNERFTGMIATQNGISYLAFFDVNTEEIYIVRGLEDVMFKNISGSLFSYAFNFANGAMVRYGQIEIEDIPNRENIRNAKVTVRFSDEDFYGGVFCAAKTANNLYFTAKLTGGDVIYTTPLNLGNLKEIVDIFEGVQTLSTSFNEKYFSSDKKEVLAFGADRSAGNQNETSLTDIAELSDDNITKTDDHGSSPTDGVAFSADAAENSSDTSSTDKKTSVNGESHDIFETSLTDGQNPSNSGSGADSAPSSSGEIEGNNNASEDKENAAENSEDEEQRDSENSEDESLSYGTTTETDTNIYYPLTLLENVIYQDVSISSLEPNRTRFTSPKTINAPKNQEKNQGKGNFKSSPYLFKGSILPIATYSDSDDTMIGLGLTYVTADPYDRWNALASVGYNFDKKRIFGVLNAQEKLNDSHFYLGESAKFHYNTKTEKLYAEGEAGIQYRPSFADGASFNAEVFLSPFYKTDADWKVRIGARTSFNAVKSMGRGPLDYAALTVSGEAKYTLGDDSELKLYSYTAFKLPHLLPIDFRKNKYTINLPATLSLSYKNKDELRFTGSLVPFALEIQGGTKYIPIYFNRLITTVGYQKRKFFNNKDTEDIIFTGITLVTTPTLGMAAGNIFCSLECILKYNINKSSNKISAEIGFNLSL